MRYLHIAADSIFVSHFSRWMEDLQPDASDYVILLDRGNDDLRHPIASEGVHVVRSRLIGLLRNLRLVRSADVIVAHGVADFAAVALMVAPRSTVKVWSGFGFDYYGTEASAYYGLLGEKTRSAVRGIRGPRTHFRELLRKRILRGAAKRAHFFSAPIPSDFAVFRSRFPKFVGTYLQLKYASLSDMVPTVDVAKRRDILVGNSAGYTNNHLDVFDLLLPKLPDDSRVVVPLSYDGDAEYIAEVVRVGREKFGKRFRPILEHQPLSQYLDTVAGCSSVIMGQRRQKALGNLIIALHSGSRVYLDPANPALAFLRDLGAQVGELADIGKDALGEIEVDADVLVTNRAALESFWGDGAVKQGLEHALGVLRAARAA